MTYKRTPIKPTADLFMSSDESRKNYNQDYFIQQGSHLDLKEISKALKTNKS